MLERAQSIGVSIVVVVSVLACWYTSPRERIIDERILSAERDKANAIAMVKAEHDQLESTERQIQLTTDPREKQVLKGRLARLRSRIDRTERIKCLCISRACVENPYAKGCM